MNNEVVVENVPIDKIVPGQDVGNDRTTFDQVSLKKLGSDIEKNGLIQPITIRPYGDGYQVVAGERRFRSVRDHSSLTSIPAMIRDISDKEASLIMMKENTHREDLDPIDESGAYVRRVEKLVEGGVSSTSAVKEVAKEAGVKVSWVKRRIELDDLIPEAKSLVRSGVIDVCLDPRHQRKHGERISAISEEHQAAAVMFIKKTGSVTLPTLRKFIASLESQEASGQSLFDLTDSWAFAVNESAVFESCGSTSLEFIPELDGLSASVHNLPKIAVDNSWTVGEIVYNWAKQLRDDDHLLAASAVADLYREMLRCRWAELPRDIILKESMMK